jgi:DNA-binding transcriptional regulator GbsR (MarR family)
MALEDRLEDTRYSRGNVSASYKRLHELIIRSKSQASLIVTNCRQ